MKFEPGSKIGDYEVLGQLGAGGMGRVYKVRNELSDRVEAMKILLPDLEGQADLANRFLREIKVQAGLDHPNIAKLYTALRIENQLSCAWNWWMASRSTSVCARARSR